MHHTSTIYHEMYKSLGFFSRTRKRAVYHYIKKKKNKESRWLKEPLRRAWPIQQKKTQKLNKTKDGQWLETLMMMHDQWVLASSLISHMMELKLCWDPSKTTISMLPNPPCHQDDQWVETLTMMLRNMHGSQTPQLSISKEQNLYLSLLPSSTKSPRRFLLASSLHPCKPFHSSMIAILVAEPLSCITPHWRKNISWVWMLIREVCVCKF